MDTELVDKHHEMRKLRKQIKDVVIELKSLLSLELLHSAIHQVGIAVKSKIKCIKSRHERKLGKFCQRRFLSFLKDFQCQKLSQTCGCSFNILCVALKRCKLHPASITP